MKLGFLKVAKSLIAGLAVINAVALGLRIHAGGDISLVMVGSIAVLVLIYYALIRAQNRLEVTA